MLGNHRMMRQSVIITVSYSPSAYHKDLYVVPSADDSGDVRRSIRSRSFVRSMIESVRGISPTAAATVSPPVIDIGTPTKFKHNIEIKKAPDGTFTGIDGLPDEMLKVIMFIMTGRSLPLHIPVHF